MYTACESAGLSNKILLINQQTGYSYHDKLCDGWHERCKLWLTLHRRTQKRAQARCLSPSVKHGRKFVPVHKPGLVRDLKLPFHTSTGMPIALGGAHRKHTTKPQLLLAMHTRHPIVTAGHCTAYNKCQPNATRSAEVVQLNY